MRGDSIEGKNTTWNYKHALYIIHTSTNPSEVQACMGKTMQGDSCEGKNTTWNSRNALCMPSTNSKREIAFTIHHELSKLATIPTYNSFEDKNTTWCDSTLTGMGGLCRVAISMAKNSMELQTLTLRSPRRRRSRNLCLLRLWLRPGRRWLIPFFPHLGISYQK